MHVTRAAPSSEPVALADAKAFLNVRASDTRHDDQITRLITAARRECEKRARKAIPEQNVTIELDANEATGTLWLVPPPVISITSFKFYDASESDWSGAIDASNYLLVSPSTGRVIEQNDGWQSLAERDDLAFQVVYKAGWAIASIPTNVIQAVYLALGEMFEKRMPVQGEASRDIDRLLNGIRSLRQTPIR